MSTKYQDALVEAKRELYELLIQHEQAEKRISKLKLTIAGLKQLCGDESAIADGPRELTFAHASGMGLTNIIREILKRSDSPLSAIDVKDKMTALGLPIEDYKNALATIHIILKRLHAKGEIQPIENEEKGPTAYLHIPTAEQTKAVAVHPSVTVARAAEPNNQSGYYHRRLKRAHPVKKEEE